MMEYEEPDLDIEDFGYGSKTTLPDYQNVRNIMLWQFEEINDAVVELRLCKSNEYKTYLRNFIKKYVRFFTQINDNDKLSHLSKEQKKYMKHYFDNPLLINRAVAKNLVDISRELMNKYGIFNLERGDEDYR